jgi:A/G-specific adenine glycosylase
VNLTSRRTAFRRALHAWYRRHHRRLPWRAKPSLYGTVVSEFMLQQTQIKTALPYFKRWMTALPDFTALAAAPESAVLRLWEGLGYYSRARNLRRLAQALTALPAPPVTPDGWQDLPGVGPYTAAAIASMSFGARVACIDGNVVRVLARLTADRTEFRDSAAAARHFMQQADALVPSAAPGEHNQAMMELGALVCRRHDPCCAICPVRPFCAAARLKIQGDLPRFVRKRTSRKAVTRAWCEHEGRLLLRRADTGARRLAGLYELPTPPDLGLDDAAVRTRPLLLRRKRAITDQQITELIHAVPLTPAQRRQLEANTVLHWVPWASLDDIALSGPHRRWVEEIRRDRRAGARVPCVSLSGFALQAAKQTADAVWS